MVENKQLQTDTFELLLWISLWTMCSDWKKLSKCCGNATAWRSVWEQMPLCKKLVSWYGIGALQWDFSYHIFAGMCMLLHIWEYFALLFPLCSLPYRWGTTLGLASGSEGGTDDCQGHQLEPWVPTHSRPARISCQFLTNCPRRWQPSHQGEQGEHG